MRFGLKTVAAGLANLSWALLLVGAAVVSFDDGPGPALPDWLLHALGYGVQGGLFWWLLVVAGLDRRAAVPWSVAVAVGLGALTEFLQLSHPGRSAELRDVVADGVGALVVVVVLTAFRSRSRTRSGLQAP